MGESLLTQCLHVTSLAYILNGEGIYILQTFDDLAVKLRTKRNLYLLEYDI